MKKLEMTTLVVAAAIAFLILAPCRVVRINPGPLRIPS